jgi:hypothetical protein
VLLAQDGALKIVFNPLKVKLGSTSMKSGHGQGGIVMSLFAW